MNTHLHRTIYMVILLIALISLVACPAGAEKAGPLSAGVLEVDQSIKPGDDFYQYANGPWIRIHPVPPDRGDYGAFDEVYDRNRTALRQILEEAAQKRDAEPGSIEQKLGDFYRTGMDTAAIDRDGINPIKSLLERIESLKAVEEVPALAAFFQAQGIDALCAVYSEQDPHNSAQVITRIYQGGIGLPDRDYYTKTDKKSGEIRREYVKHIASMLVLLGDKSEDAASEALRIMELETEMAKASLTMVECRDPRNVNNVMSLRELTALSPRMNWARYLEVLGYPRLEKFNVGQPDYMKKLDRMLASVSLQDWKLYLRWRLIDSTAEYLSKPFEEEHFAFFHKYLEGKQAMEDRWKRVLSSISFQLGQLLGRPYVEKYFPPGAKKRMEIMVGDLRESFSQIIEGLSWMTPETKKQALEKLRAMTTKIGYPDRWEDCQALEIKNDSYVQNKLRVNHFFFRFGPSGMEYAGHLTDRSRWVLPPHIVNAMYDPLNNEIVFPAGILQPPFFDMSADDAINYGGIGTVIGHEMTHGFDDEGRRYDREGNLKDWWTASDDSEFKKRCALLVEQFNHYEVLPGVFINGELTLGENIADLGGLNIALRALELRSKGQSPAAGKDGFSDRQRFFLSYARIWRSSTREETLRQLVIIDPHSPNRYRVNGPLFDLEEFYGAFPQIKPGDRLYRPKESRPMIWGVQGN